MRNQPGPRSTASGAARGGRGGGSLLPPSSQTTASRGVVRQERGRPARVVEELQRTSTGPASTARGRAIQHDLEALGEDYFGGAEGRAPPARPAGDAEESAYAKFTTCYTAAALPAAWRRGPLDTAGRCFDASDRNLLCMDVFTPPEASLRFGGPGRRRPSAASLLCVVGSADHGLKVFDLVTMREKKSLYTKAYGHTEWVTTCRFLPSGRILSGGMDSKLCLWDSVFSGPPRCQDLLGHTGSISQVEVNDQGVAVSSSYDRTLRLWDCAGGGRDVGCLAGHTAPVMQFAWSGTQVLSGDRGGAARLWDLETATCLLSSTTKRGQIGSLGHLLHPDMGHLTLLGDQGGVLTVLDLRQGRRPVFQGEIHPGGVLSGIQVVEETPYIVTGGADRRLVVLDPRRGFGAVHVWTDHEDFIYSMKTIGPLVVSGAGNGWLLVHDTTTGNCCYGLGANEAAVREIFPTPSFLVTAGDDGKATVYDYDGTLAEVPVSVR